MFALVAAWPDTAAAYVCAPSHVPAVEVEVERGSLLWERGAPLRLSATSGDCKHRYLVRPEGLLVERAAHPDGPYVPMELRAQGAAFTLPEMPDGVHYLRVGLAREAPLAPAQLVVVAFSEGAAREVTLTLSPRRRLPALAHAVVAFVPDVPLDAQRWTLPQTSVAWRRGGGEQRLRLPSGRYDIGQGTILRERHPDTHRMTSRYVFATSVTLDTRQASSVSVAPRTDVTH